MSRRVSILTAQPRKNILASRISAGHCPPRCDGCHDGVVLEELLQSISGKSRSASGSIGSTPTYATYASRMGTYNYCQPLRLPFSTRGERRPYDESGMIKRPLITVAGTMDALLPIKHHARAYDERQGSIDVAAKAAIPRRDAQYRLYEVQNGNHIESYKARHSASSSYAAACADVHSTCWSNVEQGPRCRRTSAFPEAEMIHPHRRSRATARRSSYRKRPAQARGRQSFAAVKWSGRRITGGRFIW